mgnify:CR=1 FL=1
MAFALQNPRFSGANQNPAGDQYGAHIAGALTGYALYSPSESPSNEAVPAVLPVIPAILPVAVAAGGTDVDVVLPFACRVLLALGYKVGAGDTGCQVELFNGADLIGTIDCDASAKAFVSLGDCDLAYVDFAAGDTLKFTPTDAGTGDAACQLQVFLQRL